MKDPGWIFEVRSVHGCPRELRAGAACSTAWPGVKRPAAWDWVRQAGALAAGLTTRHLPSLWLPGYRLPQYLWQVFFSVDHGSIWPWGFMPRACLCFLYNQSCEAALNATKWEFEC